jgi:hypothetical protein
VVVVAATAIPCVPLSVLVLFDIRTFTMLVSSLLIGILNGGILTRAFDLEARIRTFTMLVSSLLIGILNEGILTRAFDLEARIRSA